jgi:hypothetical protein
MIEEYLHPGAGLACLSAGSVAVDAHHIVFWNNYQHKM